MIGGLTGETSRNRGDGVKSDKPKTLVGYDAFLKLLVAQLRQQDPMNPVDSSTYISQVTQLSSLEQSLAQTAALESVSASQRTAEASALLGQMVIPMDGESPSRIVGTRNDGGSVMITLADGRELAVGDGIRLVTP
jgi:flagellar basal-body rod modification protein FlgD